MAVERTLKSLLELKVGVTKPAFSRAGVVTARALVQAHAAQLAGNAVTGLPTGYIDLDAKTLGWQKSDLIVVAARPGMGKTSFGLAMGQNAAFDYGAKIAIFSLEMSEEQVSQRLLCSEARVDSYRLRSGYLSPEEWGRLNDAQLLYNASKIWIDDTPAISSVNIRAKAMRLEMEEGKLDLIVVDYLGLMGVSTKKSESRQQDVSSMSRDLKALAKEMHVPVIALCQLNRGPENRPNHRPTLADLRDSGAIEQDADIVAFIYREEMYHKIQDATPQQQDALNTAEIIIEKNRMGATGTVMLRFDPVYTRFDNLA
jgi:replicative DNA helicase